jgi:hypothetical protein
VYVAELLEPLPHFSSGTNDVRTSFSLAQFAAAVACICASGEQRPSAFAIPPCVHFGGGGGGTSSAQHAQLHWLEDPTPHDSLGSNAVMRRPASAHACSALVRIAVSAVQTPLAFPPPPLRHAGPASDRPPSPEPASGMLIGGPDAGPDAEASGEALSPTAETSVPAPLHADAANAMDPNQTTKHRRGMSSPPSFGIAAHVPSIFLCRDAR